MADSTITGYSELAQADLDYDTDVLEIVDVGASTNKKITPESLVLGAMEQAGLLSKYTNSIAANVALNNTSNYFTGPSVAQGTAGVWFASGTVTLADTAGAATFNVKLWDGTTVIASAAINIANTNVPMPVSLSGYIDTPAGDIRISVKDLTSTSGLILRANTGEVTDSTLSVFRIAQ
jgi:hypothetical protein